MKVSDVLMEISKQARLSFKQVNWNVSAAIIETTATEALQIDLAEQVDVSGKITDENGDSLPGASVLEKGTSNGTVTDIDGNFKVTVAEGATLTVSFVGYKTQQIVVGDQNTINIQMQVDAEQLQEVVVTALGIKREEKTLTYAQQTVKGDALTKSRDISFASSLAGKAAGLTVRKSTSGPGGSTNIQIRGSKSLTGTSNPLFVIDGIPMTNNRGEQPGVWGGIDQGDGLSQLNPDDIESISILKGANAAILYGSQGANGVVIITTKSGKSGPTTVEVNSGFTFETITDLPELQYRYGGAGSALSSTMGDYDDTFVEDYFRTGKNYINSVSISGGNDKTQAYFSFSNTSSTGVSPTNKYEKNNVSFKQSTKMFNNKLKVTSNVILAQENIDGRSRGGYYNNPLLSLYLFPRHLDFSNYKTNYSVFDPSRNLDVMNWPIDQDVQNNPYWMLNKEPQEDKVNRVIASFNLDYDISEKLKIQVRGNQDYAVKEYNKKYAAGGNAVTVLPNGRWEYEKFDDTSTYLDGILSYTDTFGDISLTAIAGASYQKNVFGNGMSLNTNSGSIGLHFANEFFFQNVADAQIQSKFSSRVEKQSVFGNATIGFKEMVFLDLAVRNDWASTLALTGNESYLYPSVGLTTIVSEMFELPEFVSFAKVRGSWAQVGNEVGYNSIAQVHSIGTGGTVSFNTIKPFTDATPEIITTTEVGVDLRFFSNRLGLDATYYDINSQDQFIRVNEPSVIYASFFVNAGEITNKGIEVTLSGKPIVTDNLTWSTAINYSNNTNKIVELYEGIEVINQGGATGENVNVQLRAGGSISDVYGTIFQRDDQGRILIDATGAPEKEADFGLLGNAQADYIIGWSNSIDYKKLSLNFQLNGSFGGVVVSQTESLLDGDGVSERTALARDRGYVSINGVDENGVAVTQVDPEIYYSTVGGRGGVKENYAYDRTNIRLSQLSLSYALNVEKLSWIKKASVSFVANNLLFLYNAAPFDPEVTLSTGSLGAGIDNFSLPSTKTYGLNLSLTF